MVLEMGGPAREPGMLCPHCRVTLAMTTRSNVEIDYCPKCRGVWLDRGELDKIIERAAEHLAPEPRARKDDDDDRYKRRDKKRKKSWIAEIFDELT